jgi:hypothetical protein
MSRSSLATSVIVLVGLLITSQASAAPQPIGTSTTTISYTTGNGVESYSQSIDYTGMNITDAVPVGAAPNTWSFNSANMFGRRTFVANTGFPQVLDTANESLIANAFFKGTQSNDYFPGIVEDSMVNISIDGINFDQNVFVDDSTAMLHSLFQINQVDQLPAPYVNTHNHTISGSSFRDMDEFVASNVFNDDGGVANYVLDSDDFTFAVSGEGTDTLSVDIAFSYQLLKNFEETGQMVPDGLPAPHGFLEPFHFHIEYVVTPEPATALILAAGAIGFLRRRRRD